MVENDLTVDSDLESRRVDHDAPERLGMRDEIRRSLNLAKANLLKALTHLDARAELTESKDISETMTQLEVMTAIPAVEKALLLMRKRKKLQQVEEPSIEMDVKESVAPPKAMHRV